MSVDITLYQHGKMFYIFFIIYSNVKTRRIRKISVFTSGGKFSVFTLSYVNTALNQSAFWIHKCYIIINAAVSKFFSKMDVFGTSFFPIKVR